MKKRYVEQPDRKQYKRKYILRKVEDKEAKKATEEYKDQVADFPKSRVGLGTKWKRKKIKDATSKLTRSEEDPEVPLQQVWRVD